MLNQVTVKSNANCLCAEGGGQSPHKHPAVRQLLPDPPLYGSLAPRVQNSRNKTIERAKNIDEFFLSMTVAKKSKSTHSQNSLTLLAP